MYEATEITLSEIDVQLDSVVPVYISPLSERDIAEFQTTQEEFNLRQAAEKDREQARKSALKKLEKLGLTEEELKAMLT